MIPEHYFKETKKELIESKKKIVSAASAVIAISEATKNEMIKIYDIDPDLIHVIYHGYTDFDTTSLSDAGEQKLNRDEPYILFIGHRDFYKNFTYFIKTAALFLKKNNIRLNIIGFPASPEETLLINELGLNNLVVFLQHVSESELYHYYNKALCFVFPSIAEGFGIPLLESFSSRCPVICSDIPIFREIGGDAAMYFQLDDENSLVNCLESVLNDGKFRETLINRGISRYKMFQWKENAMKTLDAYKFALGN
jgi:glycosyltransferase involved in cell wall biosynthesis